MLIKNIAKTNFNILFYLRILFIYLKSTIMKTKFFSILAILFVCISLNLNSVNAGSGCDTPSHFCWAFGAYGYLSANATWYISTPSLHYRIWVDGQHGYASFSCTSGSYSISSLPSGLHYEKQGTVSSSGNVYVFVSQQYYSTGWAEFSW